MNTVSPVRSVALGRGTLANRIEVLQVRRHPVIEHLHDVTHDVINELLPAELGISVSYPLPGTVFYEKVKMELKEKSNWTDSDELQLMFRNTYRPEFYKQLHRFVHKSYRRHAATNAWKEMLQHPASINQKQIKKAASLAYYLPAEFVAKRKLEKLEKK